MDYITSNKCSSGEVQHEALEAGLRTLGHLRAANYLTNQGRASAAAQTAAALAADWGAIHARAAAYWKCHVCDIDSNCGDPS